MRRGRGREVTQDIALIFLSIAVAIALADRAPSAALFGGNIYLGILFAGALFSSVFTTAPAIVLLAGFGNTAHPAVVGLLGGAGAVLADLLLFQFVKGRLAEDANYLLKEFHLRKLRHFLKIGWIRWIAAFFGAIVIASPLPDELGIALLGISRMHAFTFAPLAYIMNSLGIYLIALLGAH